MNSRRCASALAFLLIHAAGPAVAQVKASNEPLENTYWRLIRLGDEEVSAVPNQREAHFILHRATRHFSGAGGCNRMTGNYDLGGDRLSFDRMISTMMACAQGMETEQKFLAALRQTSVAKVTQQQLELLDEGGKSVARLQAVHLK